MNPNLELDSSVMLPFCGCLHEKFDVVYNPGFSCYHYYFVFAFVLNGNDIHIEAILQMDNVISQAHATLGALMSQRSAFGGITTKISSVGSRLPMVFSISFICVSINSLQHLIYF